MEARGHGDAGPPAGYVHLGDDGGDEGSSPHTGSPASVSEAAAAAAAISEPSSDFDSDPEGWEPLREEVPDEDEVQQALDTASNGGTGHPLTAQDGNTANAQIWRATFPDDTDSGLPSSINLENNGISTVRCPPELDIGGVPAAGEAHALARGPDATPLDFTLGSDAVEAVKAGMQGVSLEYAPHWASAVSESEWQRVLRERLEGRRGEQYGAQIDADR